MRSAARMLALAALLAVGSCSLGGRVHLGEIWMEGGHGLATVGNHVTLAID